MMRRPEPLDEHDRARWEHTGLRHRMLRGEWGNDAVEYMHTFFDARVTTSLTEPDTSRNALKTYSTQLNTLYKEPPAVATDATDDLEALALDDLWPMQQNTGLSVVALNEAIVRVDYNEARGIHYRPVTPDNIGHAMLDENDPTRLVYVEELRKRTVIEDGRPVSVWTWETWNITDPAAPVFRIEREGEKPGDRVDVTADFYDGEGYPYTDASGAPVMPYVLYHKRYGAHLWAAHEGRELVVGTLRAVAYWTFWGVGLRDTSYPIRALLNGKLNGTSARIIDGVPNQEELIIGPNTIVTVSDHNGSARLDEWRAGMEPSSFAMGIETYELGLAVHAGLSPSDVAKGSAGQSGYAIVVKQKGMRDVQAAMIPAARVADRLLLATAARLANSYAPGVSGLPEDPAEYRIEYAQIGESPEERKARAEADSAEVEAGYRDPREGWVARHPGTTKEDALPEMMEAARIRQLLANPEAAAAAMSGREDMGAARDLLVDAMRRGGLTPEDIEDLADILGAEAMPDAPEEDTDADA